MDLVRGAVDPRGGYVSKILHVKTKESGPVGGGRAPGAPPLDPPMILIVTTIKAIEANNDAYCLQICFLCNT